MKRCRMVAPIEWGCSFVSSSALSQRTIGARRRSHGLAALRRENPGGAQLSTSARHPVVPTTGNDIWFGWAGNTPPERWWHGYQRRYPLEIVFPQMTKPGVFAFWTGRDCVTDLNIFVCDDHPIDQQFHQLPPLLKRSLVQTGLHALAKHCDRSIPSCQLLLLDAHLSFLVSLVPSFFRFSQMLPDFSPIQEHL